MAYVGSTPAGYYSTPSTPTPGMPGPLLRLKTGTESATPSVNGVIARNLLRLANLLEDDEYRTLCRQTCHSFAVEILQHPFLFVGLLDAVVGLEAGSRNITGVFSTSTITNAPQPSSSLLSKSEEPTSVRDLIVQKIRSEVEPASFTSTTTTSLVATPGAGRSARRRVVTNCGRCFPDWSLVGLRHEALRTHACTYYAPD